MDILAVTAELFPLVKTGGLADVAASLPKALKAFGIRVRTLVPGYPEVLDALADRTVVRSYSDLFGVAATLLSGMASGLELLVLDAPFFFSIGQETHTRIKMAAITTTTGSASLHSRVSPVISLKARSSIGSPPLSTRMTGTRRSAWSI
jgi:glycogen synthase